MICRIQEWNCSLLDWGVHTVHWKLSGQFYSICKQLHHNALHYKTFKTTKLYWLITQYLWWPHVLEWCHWTYYTLFMWDAKMTKAKNLVPHTSHNLQSCLHLHTPPTLYTPHPRLPWWRCHFPRASQDPLRPTDTATTVMITTISFSI